jgi:hypothetical protein
MDTTSSNNIDLHLEILPSKTRKALDFFSKETWLQESGWYLAGGTALALQAGHRKSVDLDFFTKDTDFSNDELLAHFSSMPDWTTDINEKNTVYGELYGAKVSFIAYPSFIPIEQPILYGSIKILKPSDIAVMKVIAISQRGKKRDFFDLYWLMQHGEILEITVQKLKNQYPSVAHNYHHILKSLVYFADADTDPAPDINFEASWKDVKNYFINQIPNITRNLVDLK